PAHTCLSPQCFAILWCLIPVPPPAHFFFDAPATTEIYTLSLHDALPIYIRSSSGPRGTPAPCAARPLPPRCARRSRRGPTSGCRSEEHTSELQSRRDLVCRLLLEKKNSARAPPRVAPRLSLQTSCRNRPY